MSAKLQRASEYFKISETSYKKTGAFNPVIGVDSLFFVDALLLSQTSVPELKGGLDIVRGYFSEVITLLRVKNGKARILAFRRLILREVKGIGIGYGSKTDDGSAIGPELARRLLVTAEEVIEMGIADPAIFEVMGLFEEDFGPDRLSDAIIRILLQNLYTYSERVTKELSIKEIFVVKTYGREYQLAKHPLKNGPLIFIPADIIRALPVASSFDEIGEVTIFNEELRKKFNQLLAACFTPDKDNKKPKKRDIKRYLLGSKDRIGTLVEVYGFSKPDPYDFGADPEGLYQWLEKAKELVTTNPISVPTHVKKEQLDDIVQKIIIAFKKFIESKGGWKSLYGPDGKPLNESHARHFFYATAMLYCEMSDVDISPESNAGQGPVDFKLSRGHSEKIVVEVKLTSGNVLQGYEKQTRIYQESEDAKGSYYMVMQVTEKSKVLDQVLRIAEEEDKEGKVHPTVVVVDGRERPSASKA